MRRKWLGLKNLAEREGFEIPGLADGAQLTDFTMCHTCRSRENRRTRVHGGYRASSKILRFPKSFCR